MREMWLCHRLHSFSVLAPASELDERTPASPYGFAAHFRQRKSTILCMVLFLWLGRQFVKITFSQQEDDPIVDIEEIRALLDETEGKNE
jgi:hypothetical protein